MCEGQKRSFKLIKSANVSHIDKERAIIFRFFNNFLGQLEFQSLTAWLTDQSSSFQPAMTGNHRTNLIGQVALLKESLGSCQNVHEASLASTGS